MSLLMCIGDLQLTRIVWVSKNLPFAGNNQLLESFCSDVVTETNAKGFEAQRGGFSQREEAAKGSGVTVT